MKKFTIDITESGWDGQVELNLLPYNQRLEVIKSFGEEEDDMKKSTMLVDRFKEDCVSFKATYTDGDFVESFDSLDDLSYCEHGTSLINQMATMVIKGKPVKNCLKVT